MLHKCDFSLWAQSKDSSFVEDRAFSCFAQAQEGDFTVGKEKLNKVAEIMAYNWVYMRVNPDTVSARYVCQQQGFCYDNLLDQEVDYLSRQIEEEVNKYAAN